ncbi:cupin domain-containing protein [Streptosporangium lutulentum]
MPEILVPETADLARMVTAAGAFSVPTSDVRLSPDELDPAQILAGSPRVSSIELWSSPDGTQSRGIWEITPGTVTDVEHDEVFVVLSGRATVEVEGARPSNSSRVRSACSPTAPKPSGRSTRPSARCTTPPADHNGGAGRTESGFRTALLEPPV